MTEQFSWENLGIDDGGMPIHLPMGVTADGDGPTSDAEAHHFVCWCGQQCPLDEALKRASTKNADQQPSTYWSDLTEDMEDREFRQHFVEESFRINDVDDLVNRTDEDKL